MQQRIEVTDFKRVIYLTEELAAPKYRREQGDAQIGCDIILTSHNSHGLITESN